MQVQGFVKKTKTITTQGDIKNIFAKVPLMRHMKMSHMAQSLGKGMPAAQTGISQ